MVDLISDFLNQLCLVVDFLAEVLALILETLSYHLDLVQVPFLTCDSVPLNLDQLLVGAPLVILDFFISDVWLVVDPLKPLSGVLRLQMTRCTLGFLYQVIDVHCLVFDHLDNGLC